MVGPPTRDLEVLSSNHHEGEYIYRSSLNKEVGEKKLIASSGTSIAAPCTHP